MLSNEMISSWENYPIPPVPENYEEGVIAQFKRIQAGTGSLPIWETSNGASNRDEQADANQPSQITVFVSEPKENIASYLD